jgi:1-deoxy-D-xylulose-5-phosphate reductoisomerase
VSGAASRVAILGSTGSIGVSTLDVLTRHPDRFSVFALTANSNIQKLLAQCLIHRPRYAVLGHAAAAAELAQALRAKRVATEVLSGPKALEDIASRSEVDVVMAAIVGAAGLEPTLAAARTGKRILLANKEALVMSGPLFMQAVAAGGAQLLPIDSEHNAIFQCLPQQATSGTCTGRAVAGVRKIMLTASGGPFLRASAESLLAVTPEQACAHPRWSMGRKISVDSATLMNKGLELIEACLLFGVPESQIEIVIHPQSVVHSMVEYLDGSVLAQLGNPDMRTPIAHALGCPDRLVSGVESLDLVRVGRLDFESPDVERFPAIKLARAAAQAGGTAPTVLNAANEVAVEAFLSGQLAFTEITALIDRVMQAHTVGAIGALTDVLAADAWARERAQALM